MMAEDKEAIDAVEMESKRTVKLTEKALEDKLYKLIGARRGVLACKTGKRKEVESLRGDAGNLKEVQECMHDDFPTLVIEFKELTRQEGDLLSEEERAADLTNWFEPKMIAIRQFEMENKKWMDALSESKTNEENTDDDDEKEEEVQDEDVNDDIGPEDSASQVSVANQHKKSLQLLGTHLSRPPDH